jgi:hypothetical protein
MKRPTFEMLAAPNASYLLLEGRIRFRKEWALSQPRTKKPCSDRDLAFEFRYDEEFNFAHMGARYVDAQWGMPKSKPKASAKSRKGHSPQVQRLLELMRARKSNSAADR